MSFNTNDNHNIPFSTEQLPTVLYRTNTSEMFSPLPQIVEEPILQHQHIVDDEQNNTTLQPIILVTPVVSQNFQFDVVDQMALLNITNTNIYGQYDSTSDTDTDEESYMDYIHIKTSIVNYPNLAPLRVAPVHANLDEWFPPQNYS